MNRRPPENDPESPSYVDEPSPKKSKRGLQKRVVSVPIGGGADVDGSKSSRGGDSYPPSDSWAWRKYGQKPIKGSPYPRGYYRCSSSKGCPARKQVERSRVDPTTLIVTYACDHNHTIPAKPQQPHAPPQKPHASAFPESTPQEESDVSSTTVTELSDLGGGSGAWVFDRIICEWFGSDDVASTSVVLESPTVYDNDDVDADDAAAEVSGEDESLFGDLGELPECSMVFRRRIGVPICGGEGFDLWTALV